MAIYSTTAQEGIDVNSVFILDPVVTPEYPAPPFNPGELAWGTDGSEWVYVTSSITIAAGSALVVSAVPGSWSVALTSGILGKFGQLVAVCGGSLGTLSVPAPTGTQTGNFFWAQVAGNCPNLRTSAATTDYTALHTTTTGGVLFSTTGGAGTTAGVTGIVVSQATGSAAGPNTAILNNPTIGATD